VKQLFIKKVWDFSEEQCRRQIFTILKYLQQLLPVNDISLFGSNSFFPPDPEFQPGVPWKGIQNIDPESDPYVTPGSVLGGTATSPIVDTDHQLLRDNTTGKTVNNWYVII